MQNTTTLSVRIFRLIRLLLHIASGVMQAMIYPYFSKSVQRRMKQKWAAKFLAILNIQLRCIGKPLTHGAHPVLFVANHVSWLDICSVLAACPTRFVAKAEIRNWPVIGLLSRKVETLFIERAKRTDTLRTNQLISKVLEQGDHVMIFPEGTTSDGTMLRHFHASLLQSAIMAGAFVYPVAICYRNEDGAISKEAAYVDPSLLFSLRRILSQPRIEATLTFIDPIHSNEKNRRELTRMTEQAIATTLSVTVAHKEPGKFSGLLNE